MSETKITIMVSTVDHNILSNRELLSIPFNDKLNMLVINQKINKTEDLMLSLNGVMVVNTYSKGLSQSRNLGLDSLDGTDYVLIADDDVAYVPNFESIIKDSIEKFIDAFGITFQIITPEGELYKKYPLNGFNHDWRSILKVSSISVLLNFKRWTQTNVHFDTRFGIGNNYPSGEENIFLSDCLKKGGIIRYVPKPIVIHPKVSSGSIINEKLLFAKGALFRKLFGIFGIFIIVLFVIRKVGSPIRQSFWRLLFAGVKGFFSFPS